MVCNKFSFHCNHSEMYEMFCVVISGLTFVWVLSADPGIAWLLSRLHSRNYRVSAKLGQRCLATKISAPGPSSFGWFRHNSLQVWGGMWVPRSKLFLNPYLVVKLVLVPASCSIYKKNKKRRVVAMVIILSSHQQNTMVSTLNVLLLTLNKALPGGRPRIARVSLMVRVIFSLNKF